MMDKKGQFFIVGMVVLALAFFLIFTFVQTTSSSEALNAKRSSEQDLINVFNVIEERNEVNAADWYDVNWKYRQKYTLTTSGHCVTTGGAPAQFPITIKSSRLETSDCSRELVVRAINVPALPLTTYVNAPSCTAFSILCGTANTYSEYYIYYGNSNAAQSNTVASWTQFASGTTEEQSAMINCTQLGQDYQQLGYQFSCSPATQQSQTVTYNVNFIADDLKYDGTAN